MEELSNNEKKLIMALRSLKAFERIEIVADASGKPDTYLVIRSFKEMWKKEDTIALK